MHDKCLGCGGFFDMIEGPTHKYMLSSPGCWSAYGDVLAREYQNPVLFGSVHRLTVDAYALQHPGDPDDRRARQSVWVHFAALHLALHRNEAHASIPPIMQKLAGGSFPDLPPAPQAFDMTLADVIAQGPDQHIKAVREWADCAYRAWAPLEQPVRAMLAAF